MRKILSAVFAFALIHGTAAAKEKRSEGYLTLSKEQAARQTRGLQRPNYPSEYRKLHLQASMVLRLSVSATGRIDRVDVMRYQGAPQLVDFAVSYSKQNWRFAPYMHDGKPTAVRFETPLEFIIVTSPAGPRG